MSYWTYSVSSLALLALSEASAPAVHCSQMDIYTNFFLHQSIVFGPIYGGLMDIFAFKLTLVWMLDVTEISPKFLEWSK